MTAAVALCAAIAACTTVSGTGRKQLNVYSTNQENAMGAQAYQDEMKNAKIISSGPVFERVQKLARALPWRRNNSIRKSPTPWFGNGP